MSGHNKWSKIKNKKAVSDSKKSAIFSKVAKLLYIEAKKAGGDETSPSLRAAIEKARAVNMPRDNIERAIKKAEGEGGENMEQITYEAYGPGGVALIIEALTASRNKAAAEIKHILSENSLSLASPGSALWAFKKDPATNNLEPTTLIKLSPEDSQKLEKLVEELEANEEVQEVFTNAE